MSVPSIVSQTLSSASAGRSAEHSHHLYMVLLLLAVIDRIRHWHIHRHDLIAPICRGIAVALLAFSASAGSDEMQTQAIWKTQSIKLVHRSTYTHYSCEMLIGRLLSVAHAVGAHVPAGGEISCNANGANHAVTITLRRPIEATAENVRREVQFDGTAQLAARVRGIALPTETDIQRFPAVWKNVSLTKIRGARIDNADCSLMLTMQQQLFPRIGVRVAQEKFHCVEGASLIRPRFIVEALVPARIDDRVAAAQTSSAKPARPETTI